MPRHARRSVFLALWLAVWLAGPTFAQSVYADTLPWAEPRALNVVDLAGQVPDEVLAGHIVCDGDPGGLILYESSSWAGPKLRIRVSIYPRYDWTGHSGWVTNVPLLGHAPAFDRPSSSAPRSWLRLYHGSVDVTREVVFFGNNRPDLALPINASGEPRYSMGSEFTAVPATLPADGIEIPANWGGFAQIYREYDHLTGVFTIVPSHRPIVTYMGEELLSYPSYIGPGFVGWFEPLMQQMRSKYSDRHPRLALTQPAGANYVLFDYQPMPYNVGAGYWAHDSAKYERNRNQPVAGSVRFAAAGGMLSQDLNHAGPFPLDVWWQDADQSAGPYLSVFTTPIHEITPPEFVVLPGTAYNPCFTNGGCSDAVLRDVDERRATLRVVYLSVQPVLSGLRAIPLRVADTNWTPSMGSHRWNAGAGLSAQIRRVFLPIVLKDASDAPAIPSERPVGFFDPESGRMVGYWSE